MFRRGIIAFLTQSPRRLEYLEHQLWIPESVAGGGLLENLENPPAFRTMGAVLFIEEFGFFTCGECFVGLGSLNSISLPELSNA